MAQPFALYHLSVKERILHIKKNVSLSELSGSLGDLGTLLPILIALSIKNSAKLDELDLSLMFSNFKACTSCKRYNNNS